jgi:ferredoxin
MSNKIVIQPNLIKEMEQYGAIDVKECFNCGTCSATCPLVEDTNEFPRGIIRLAQLGQKEKLLGSKELWLCYYCGDCSASCPRGADPAGFMQAARRYAIADNDVTGLSKVFNKNKYLALLILVLFGLFYVTFMYLAYSESFFAHDYQVLGGYYGEFIHYTGMAMGIFMAVVLVIGAIRMYRSIANHEPLRQREYILEHIPRVDAIKLAVKTLITTLYTEGALQERFRKDEGETVFYEEGNPPDYVKSRTVAKPLKVTKWQIHMSIVWGFFGLAFATAYDYIIKDIIQDNPAGWVPIYHPIRLLGIVSGLLMMFGTSMAIYYRIIKPEGKDYYQNTKFEDWLILILIWGAGLTGFLATTMVYLPELPSWAGWILIAHVAIVMQLFLVLPLTKFAHMIYRPLALWMTNYEKAKITYLENKPPESTETEEVLQTQSIEV